MPTISDVMPPMPSMAGIGSFLIAVGIIIFVAIALGLFTWFFIQRLKNNKKAIVFKKIGNKVIRMASFKARSERIGNAGDYLFCIPKIKKILSDPDTQMGKNEYWFYIRADGEWINFSLGDVDEQMKECKANYVHDDMRLQRLGIQKNLKERLQKDSFWGKYGNQIITVIYVIILMVCLIVLFNKMNGVWTAGSSAAKATVVMAEQVEGMAAAVSRMASTTGSGVIPVSDIAAAAAATGGG